MYEELGEQRTGIGNDDLSFKVTEEYMVVVCLILQSLLPNNFIMSNFYRVL
jgi:hypothetical protein